VAAISRDLAAQMASTARKSNAQLKSLLLTTTKNGLEEQMSSRAG
jgi:hypothetical protein